MWELDYKESWALKNWCFWTVVLEKTLESPLDWKEIHPVHPEGDQSWVFTGRTDVEAETLILMPPDGKSWLIGKDPDAGKDWGQEEKGTTEDEIVGWHHWLNGHEFGQTPGAGDGQGGLACCGSWGRKESDTTERLNWTECMCVQSRLTLCNSMDCSLPGSSAHGILHESTGVGCHFHLQGIFPTQGSNLNLWHFLHCRWILYHWATWETQISSLHGFI